MKITDYPSVGSLTDGDVILIDGNNGTKKLPAGGDISIMTSSFDSSDNASETSIITSAGGDTVMPKMTGGDTHGGLFDGLSKAVLNTRKLINTVKRIWQTVANAWVPGATYSVGQVVTYTNGHTYICKLAHTSSSSITPDNTTYWEDKTIGDMIYLLNTNYAKIAPRILWTNSSNANISGKINVNLSNYKMVGVEYRGQLYVSDVGNNIFAMQNAAYVESQGKYALGWYYRSCTTNSTGVTFDTARVVWSSGYYTENNAYMIPNRIIGFNYI